MPVFALERLVLGQCGIRNIYEFNWYSDLKLANNEGFIDPVNNPQYNGAGFIGSGFINNEVCKEMYEYLSASYKLVFQTPVRHNKNSGNWFFYAMWDCLNNDDVEHIEHSWPLFPESSPCEEEEEEE